LDGLGWVFGWVTTVVLLFFIWYNALNWYINGGVKSNVRMAKKISNPTNFTEKLVFAYLLGTLLVCWLLNRNREVDTTSQHTLDD